MVGAHQRGWGCVPSGVLALRSLPPPLAVDPQPVESHAPATVLTHAANFATAPDGTSGPQLLELPENIAVGKARQPACQHCHT